VYRELRVNNIGYGGRQEESAQLPYATAPCGTSLFSQDTAWRGASVLAAIPPLLFSITYARRRFDVTKQPMPTGTKVLLAFYYLTAVLLLMNAVVNLPALYAFAVTVQQFTNVITFMYALRFVLDVPEVAHPSRARGRRN
jgi:hypothetical protein